MKPTPEIIQVSLVLVGKFNPAVISPAWLAYHNIISGEDVKSSKTIIHHDDVSNFTFDWASVLVVPDKIQIQSNKSPYITTCDFVVNLLSSILSSYPVIQLGINLEHTYVMDFEILDAIGVNLAPRSSWGDWGEKLTNKNKKNANGLTMMSMRQGDDLDDRKSGNINVQIGPSDKVASGLRVFVNDHYQFGEQSEVHDASLALELLSKNFAISLDRSSRIIHGILEANIK